MVTVEVHPVGSGVMFTDDVYDNVKYEVGINQNNKTTKTTTNI
jgi:hypothetical protein